MGGGWLALYAVALGALALFTAYTRNFQGTVLEVARRTDVAASDQVAPRRNAASTPGYRGSESKSNAKVASARSAMSQE